MIHFIGDTHGHGYFQKNIFEGDSKKLKDFKPKKNDISIFLGDFGYIYFPLLSANFLEKSNSDDILYTKKDYLYRIQQEYNLRYIAGLKGIKLVVPGNHDNYNEIFSLPEEEIFGSKAYVLKRKTGRIYFLKRGEVYKINGKTFFTIGGALSIDKSFRKEDESWWRLEYLTEKEKQLTINNCKKYDGKFDYILTHTCPTSVIPKIVDNSLKINDEVSNFLDKLLSFYIKDFKHWYFGHFHIDKEINFIGKKFSCLYNNIKSQEK